MHVSCPLGLKGRKTPSAQPRIREGLQKMSLLICSLLVQGWRLLAWLAIVFPLIDCPTR